MILVVCTLVFSAASVLSGFATAFIALLGARMLMGIAEGGIMPITQTLIAAEVPPERRGLAHGITQNVGANLLANFLGPIVVVAIALALGWRNAFFLVAHTRVPDGAVDRVAGARAASPRPPSEAHFRRRDAHCWPIATCWCAACCRSCWSRSWWCSRCSCPSISSRSKRLDQQQMSYIMASAGLASIAIAFIVPGLSDKLGRKPVMFVAALLGICIPLGAMAVEGTSLWPYYLVFAAGSAITGVFPLAMATIPSEVVKPGLTATALSLTMGTSEIIGGVFAPSLAGRASDAYGLAAPLWIVTGLAAAAALVVLLLRETAPLVVARRAQARVPLARAA